MDTPLDIFHYLYKNARRTIESEQAYEERQAYSIEKRKLDAQHAYELKQRRAVNERRVTLAMASSASILMKLSGAQPDHWFYSEPVHETRGWLKKREVQTGTRQQIALEGWSLAPDRPLDHTFFNNRYIPVLTADENINNHPPLVWFKEPEQFVTKESIYPLSATPLSFDDMPWIQPETPRSKHERRYASDEIMIRAEPDEEEITQLKASLEGTHSLRHGDILSKLIKLEISRNNADYDTYKKAGTERGLQKAIARVAAQHGILNLK